MKKSLMVAFLAAAVGCADTVPKEDFDKLKVELAAAKARAVAAERELEGFKTSPTQLLAEAKTALAAGRLASAKTAAETLISKHPSDPAVAEATKIKAEAERLEGEAAERRKQAQIQEEQAEAKRRALALKSMRVSKDEIRGIEFYSHKESTKFVNSRSEVALYFAARNGRPETMFFRIQYVASDWLFIERYTIKADEVVFEIAPLRGQLNRDNGSGDIWEWFEVNVGPKEQSIIDAILAAKTVTVRHQGKQYHKDRVIPPAEIERMRQVQAAFKAL